MMNQLPVSLGRAPESYILRSGEVHVWRVPLDSTAAAAEKFSNVLSAAERDRAAQFNFEKDRARFASCRAGLRLLLSRYTGTPPEKIIFRYGREGKPALGGYGGWQFNVSHSRDLAAIAISGGESLGVDIELIDPDFPRAEVAPDILSADELSDLAAFAPEDQPAYFFHLWTLKEALLKASGTGLSREPNTIRIRLDKDQNPAIVSAPPEFNNAVLHSFSFQPGYTAALAVLAPVSSLSFFSM